jgi:hypothetical protein
VTRIGAAGALATTASDLARFGDALFQHDLVSSDALATMTDIEPSAPLPCPDINRCPAAYGLGVGTEILNGFRTQGHSGSTGALVAFFPKQRLTIAVVTNVESDPYPAAHALAEAIPATRQRLDLFTIGAHGEGVLTNGTEWSDGPSWSPDGTLIAYHAYDDPEMEVRVIHPDGTGMRTVVRVPIRGRYMGYPRWSPDSTRLAFTGADGGDTDIQTVTLDGSNLTTLTTDHVPEAEPAWASDGRIAFSRLGDIFVINPGDPKIQRITNTPSEEYSLDWFPDAGRLIYTDRR